MKRPVATLSLAFGLALCLPTALFSRQIDLPKWQYEAAVEIGEQSDKHVITCTLPPEVLDLAQPGLRDLRVVRNDRTESGYVVHRSSSQTRRQVYSGRMYNVTYVPGKETSVTVDLGGKHVKNAVMVETEGTNFRRKVRIEGSDDGHDWRVVRDEGFLFRAASGRTQKALEKSIVEIPDNDQRYLRVTVFNDTDDTDRVAIRQVTAWRQIHVPAETAPMKVVKTSVAQKRKLTEITLDLGFRNVPLNNVRLEIADENFYRTFHIQGRNSKTVLVRRAPQDSPKLQRKAPVPWKHVTSGTIFRFTTRSGVEESVNLGLHGVTYRYLRVSINNGDDPPLKFRSASVDRLIQNLLFEAKPATRYTVYFGNPRALKPKYELASYVDKIARDGVISGRLSKVVPNPLYKVPVTKIPWSERHKAMLWLALTAMLAVLGFLVFRMARSTQQTRDGS